MRIVAASIRRKFSVRDACASRTHHNNRATARLANEND